MGLGRSLFDSSVPMRRRWFRAWVLLMILAACAMRATLIFEFNPVDHIWSDPGRHWNHGLRPLDASPMTAIDPVGYQLYMVVLAKLTLRQRDLVAYWTALLSIVGPWLWYRFLRELLPSREAALLGWLALAALPSWVAIYSYFMQETLMLPLLGGAMWSTWRCRRKGDTASFVLATAVWLAAGLTRGICLPLGAVAMSWLWLIQGEKPARAAASLLLLAAVAAPLAGRSWYLVRMISPHGIGQLVQIYHKSGARSIEIEFTRSGGAERWRYGFTSPAADELPLAPLSYWQSKRTGVLRLKVDLDRGRDGWRDATASLAPLTAERLAELTGDNLVRLLFGASWPDTDRSRAIGVVNDRLRWIWVPFAMLCAIALAFSWRLQRDWLLPALIVTWLFVQGLFPLATNEGRYRKPFEGLLIAQCLLLGTAIRRNRAGKRREWPHKDGAPHRPGTTGYTTEERQPANRVNPPSAGRSP